MRLKVMTAGICFLLLAAANSFAWWDTIIKNWHYVPLVKSYGPESLAPGAAKTDDLANVKVLEVSEGGPALSFTADLAPSTYGVFVVGRSPREADVGDPGGMKPFFFHVTVTDLGAKISETYRIRAAYQYIYPQTYGHEEMLRCYFIAPHPGQYKVDIAVGKGTTAGPLWVARVELRDVLGNCARKAGKTQRTMTSDLELQVIRGGVIKPLVERGAAALPKPPRERVLATCEAYWASFPPLNAPRQESAVPGQYREQDRVPKADDLKAWTMNKELKGPWTLENKALNAQYVAADFTAMKPLPGPIAGDGWGYTVEGISYTWPPYENSGGCFSIMAPLFQARLTSLLDLMQRKAADFQKTGDPESGMEGAALLLAFGHYYPALDFRPQAAWPTRFGRFYFTNHVGGGMVISGLLQGWAISEYVRAYDQLFDYIKGDQDLADFLATKVPGAKTPEDVVRYLDTNVIQRTADCNLRGDAAGDSLKMVMGLTRAALCQGPNDISKAWIETICKNIPMGLSDCGSLEDLAFGFVGRDGLVSKGSGGYSKGSIMELLDVAEMFKRYEALGGKVAVDLTDMKKYPWLVDAFRAPTQLRVAGGFVPLIGDYGDPLRTREVYFDQGPRNTGGWNEKIYYRGAWRLTGDPEFAWMAWRFGRTDETPGEWAKIEADAKKTRDPLNVLPPRVMDDFGMAVLEMGQGSDDFTKKAAVTLRYGRAHTHAHNDGLDLAVWGKSVRAISDLAAREGSPNPRLQKVHNTVEVDNVGMSNGNGDTTMPGRGWLNVFAPFSGVQYADADQRGSSHPQIKAYRRGVAMIAVGDADAYVFNVFRVAGGQVHTWCAHANQNDQFQVNADLQPASKEAMAYLAGFKTPESKLEGKFVMPDLLPRPMEGKTPDALVATWRMHPRAEQAFLEKKLADDQKVYARWRLFGHGGEALYAADGTSSKYDYDMSFLYVHNTKAPQPGSVYPSLAEVYQGQPVVQSARALKVDGAGDGAAKTVALEVKLPGDVTDLCLGGTGDGVVRKIEGGAAFDGIFGFVRKDAKGVAQAVLVGGTALTGDGFSIKFPRGQYAGEVVSTQPDRNVCVVKGDFRDVKLAGRLVCFYDPEGRSEVFTILSSEPVAERVRLTLKERMKIFQSAVSYVDEAKRELTLAAEPYDLQGDPQAYDYSEVANESLTRRWGATIACNTRWMIVATPITDADVPDANGDGKRTLTLLGNAANKDAKDKPLVALEVTRIDPATRTIFFKTPAAPYDVGGWDYVNHLIVSENGKKWMATYPGREYKVVVDGAVRMADFDAAGKDGRSVLSLFRFRPGWKMVLPSAASLQRTENGYELESYGPAKVQARGKVTVK